MINFRSEGRRFAHGRCLVPASHFFEFTGAEVAEVEVEVHPGGRGLVLLRRALAADCLRGGDVLHDPHHRPRTGCGAHPQSAGRRAAASQLVAWLDLTRSESDLLAALPAGSLHVEQVR